MTARIPAYTVYCADSHVSRQEKLQKVVDWVRIMRYPPWPRDHSMPIPYVAYFMHPNDDPEYGDRS